MLIVSKKVKEFLKQKRDLRCSDEALEALDQEVKKLCLKTSDNVLADKLKTIRSVHVPKLDMFLEDSKKTL